MFTVYSKLYERYGKEVTKVTNLLKLDPNVVFFGWKSIPLGSSWEYIWRDQILLQINENFLSYDQISIFGHFSNVQCGLFILEHVLFKVWYTTSQIFLKLAYFDHYDEIWNHAKFQPPIQSGSRDMAFWIFKYCGNFQLWGKTCSLDIF